ncbi:hypothetical protein [Halomonas qinghailakensis]|nr:hypothetical protein [Halomonas sp. ZZQ-149]
MVRSPSIVFIVVNLRAAFVALSSGQNMYQKKELLVLLRHSE